MINQVLHDQRTIHMSMNAGKWRFHRQKQSEHAHDGLRNGQT